MIINFDGGNGGGGSYVLPVASASVLGGVKVGSGLTIDSGGTISTSGGSSADAVYSVMDIYNMEYSERRALFVEWVDKVDNGETIFVSGETPTSAVTITLPLIGFKKGTFSTDRYNGGWAYFGGVIKKNNGAGYYTFAMSSAGNESGSGYSNGKFTEAPSDFYSLPAASQSSLGGVKVGSGLTISSSDKLSVNIGEGLAFSGNTIVVSGGSSGGQVIYLNKLSQAECLALYNELTAQYDYNTNSWTSAYTEDKYAFFIDLRDGTDVDALGLTDRFQDFIPMEIAYVHPTDYGGGIFFSGIVGDRHAEDGVIKVNFNITYEGASECYVNIISNYEPPREIPEPAFVNFGNDEIGNLWYNAGTQVLKLGTTVIAQGSTAVAYQDLCDYVLERELASSGGLVFGYLLPMNTNRLEVIDESGDTIHYTNPIISEKYLSNSVTIDDREFNVEMTFNYGDFKLTMWMAEGNYGANVRIVDNR